ncbi:hypothetical protein D3C78_1130620 [compost metagenome]
MRHDQNLLRIAAIFSGDHRAGGNIIPVLFTVFTGVEITGIEAADIALITHLAELLV